MSFGSEIDVSKKTQQENRSKSTAITVDSDLIESLQDTIASARTMVQLAYGIAAAHIGLERLTGVVEGVEKLAKDVDTN